MLQCRSLFYLMFTVFITFSITPSQIYAQCDQYCGTCAALQSPEQGPIISPRAGIVLPSKGRINALVVFIDFEDETGDVNNVNWPRGNGPIGIGPQWMGQFIDLTPEQQSGQKFNITTYFRDMSFGQLTIVGYPIYRRARRTIAAYKADPNTASNIPYWATREVLTSLTSQDVGGWSRFDTITTNRYYQQRVGPDGVIDLVIVCYRGRYFGNGWPDEGFAHLGDGGDYWLNGGPKVMTRTFSSGVTWQRGLFYPDCSIAFHEVGHLLLGGEERYTDASGGLWSLMGHRQVNVSYFMNAYEREQLGWITFIDPTYGLEADIPDFGTTGVAYRMAYPGLDGFLEYYFENHQSLPSRYIKIAPDNSFTYDLVDKRDFEQGGREGTKGLYIVEKERGDIRVVCADGRWKRQSTGWILNPFNQQDTAMIFQDSAIDRITGRTDRLAQRGSYMGRNYNQFIWVWRDELTGEPTWFPFSGRHGGDAEDTWKPDGNNIFSPSSNPAALFEYNTNLSIGAVHVLAENGDGSVRVKFYTAVYPLALPPSLPQGLGRGTIIGYDGVTRPKLSWEPNIEPDVVGGGTVEVWRQLEPYGDVSGPWTQLATLPSATVVFTDESIAGARLSGGGNIARYRIRVMDSSGHYSNYTKAKILYYGDNPLKIVRRGMVSSLRGDVSVTAWYEGGNVVVRFPIRTNMALRLYDILGRQVIATEEREYNAGLHAIPFATEDFPAGHYHCVIYMNGIAAAHIPLTR